MLSLASGPEEQGPGPNSRAHGAWGPILRARDLGVRMCRAAGKEVEVMILQRLFASEKG